MRRSATNAAFIVVLLVGFTMFVAGLSRSTDASGIAERPAVEATPVPGTLVLTLDGGPGPITIPPVASITLVVSGLSANEPFAARFTNLAA